MSAPAPAEVTFDDHLAAITGGAERLAASLQVAGPAAQVPTTPDWTLMALVEHTGLVHRWARTIIEGRITDFRDVPEVRAEVTDPPGDWLIAGAQALVDTLRSAPDDLNTLVFLKDALPPKYFWARRQAHETTIHAVDALSARLGRLPTAKEADIPAALAADGVDELLTGFLPRKSSELRAEAPISVGVTASDLPRGWMVRLSNEPPVTERVDAVGETDASLVASAAQLYLGLWNRGDEIAVRGEPELLGVWRDKVRIRWS